MNSKFRYINYTDLVVGGSCILSLIISLVNTKLDSVIPLYLNVLTVLGALIYWALRRDTTGMLRRSLIIGGIAGICYAFLDDVFVSLYIEYLRLEDIRILKTPLSIFLGEVYCIAVVMYLYQRLRSVFRRIYLPALLTGACGFLGGIIAGYLADRARLWQWVWNMQIMPSDPPRIGPTPLPVLIALFLTFVLSPYIVGGQRITSRIKLSDNPIAGGLRCAILLGLILFVSFYIISRVFQSELPTNSLDF